MEGVDVFLREDVAAVVEDFFGELKEFFSFFDFTFEGSFFEPHEREWLGVSYF